MMVTTGKSSSPWLWTSAACAAIALAACGGEQPAPVAPTDPTSALPMTTPTGVPAAPAPEPSSVASAEPASSAAADAGAPPKSSGGGRPPVLKTDDTSITDTFGSAPAKLEIGDDKGRAILRIPEGSLDKGYNITFQLDPKAKSGGAQVGKLYRIKSQVAGAQDFMQVATTGDPFELAMPAGGKKDANLAIGETTVDDKGKEKIKWTVIAPKRIDDATNMAWFDLPALGGDTVIHITTKAPSAPAEKK